MTVETNAEQEKLWQRAQYLRMSKEDKQRYSQRRERERKAQAMRKCQASPDAGCSPWLSLRRQLRDWRECDLRGDSKRVHSDRS